jgi:hypothetical protein
LLFAGARLSEYGRERKWDRAELFHLSEVP